MYNLIDAIKEGARFMENFLPGQKPQPTVGLKLRNNPVNFLVWAENFWLGKEKKNELLGKRE